MIREGKGKELSLPPWSLKSPKGPGDKNIEITLNPIKDRLN